MVITWAAAMRRRMGVGRIVEEDNTTLELEEEDEVPEEVKRSGISPLDYFMEKSTKENQDNVDETEDDISENLNDDTDFEKTKNVASTEENHLEENDDSEIDVVNGGPSRIKAAEQRAQEDLGNNADVTRECDPKTLRPSETNSSQSGSENELKAADIEPKVEEDAGEISIMEKAARYDNMTRELEEMKSKYDSLFKMLAVKPEPKPVQQPWGWNPPHQQGPYNPYPLHQPGFYNLPYPPPDQGSIYPSYTNYYPPPNYNLPYPPPDNGSIYPPTYHPGYPHQPQNNLPYPPALSNFPTPFPPTPHNDFQPQRPESTNQFSLPYPSNIQIGLGAGNMAFFQQQLPTPQPIENPVNKFEAAQNPPQTACTQSPNTAQTTSSQETPTPQPLSEGARSIQPASGEEASLSPPSEEEMSGVQEEVSEDLQTAETDELSKTNSESKEEDILEEEEQQSETIVETEVASLVHGKDDEIIGTDYEEGTKTLNLKDNQDETNLTDSELYEEEEKMIENAIALCDTTVQLNDTTILLDDTIAPKTNTENLLQDAAIGKDDADECVTNEDNPTAEKSAEANWDEIEVDKDDLAGAVMVYTGAHNLEDAVAEKEEDLLSHQDEDIESFIELHKDESQSDNLGSWKDSSKILNSTTNSEEDSNRATDSRHNVTKKKLDAPDEKFDGETDDEDEDFFENDEVELSPEERERQELLMMEKELKEEKARAKVEEEERKKKFALLRQRNEEFKIREKKRLEREKKEREEKARMEAELRRKEMEALKLKEAEARRERKLREMEEQRRMKEEIMRKKVEEETARQEEMRRREEEKRLREEEKANREAARRLALEKSGKQSRRDLMKNLNKRPQYHEEEERGGDVVKKRPRYQGGEEEVGVERWALFHNPQAKTQLQEFKMEEEGEEEIQEVPKERKGRVHTLFPPIIPIFASTPAPMMPRQAPGPWPGSDPNQVQGPHLKAGQGHLVPPKKKKKPEKQTQPIIPNLPRGLPGIAISKVGSILIEIHKK